MDGPGRDLIGLGHDLQLISELKDVSALREPGVFFTDEELRSVASAKAPLESLAGAFAAKEALFKALPAGETWFWTDAELVRDPHGAPHFRVHGALARQLARGQLRTSVSISHSGGFASSVVVVSGTSATAGLFNTIRRAVQGVLQRISAPSTGTPQRHRRAGARQ